MYFHPPLLTAASRQGLGSFDIYTTTGPYFTDLLDSIPLGSI